MRFIPLLIAALLLPAGNAPSQSKVRAGVEIHRGGFDVRISTQRAPRVRRVHVSPQRRVTHRTSRTDGRRYGHGYRGHTRGKRVAHGHWKLVRDQVWVPPVYEWRRDHCGRYYRVLVRPGCYQWVTRRVWVTY